MDINMFLVNHSNIEPLDPVFIELGPIQIAWYAVLILTGAMIALGLAILEGKKIGVDRGFLEDLVLVGIPVGVLGARIYYVIFEWHRYQDDLASIFRINEGGLAIHGAVIAALIWGYFLAKKRGVDFLRVIDLGAVGFLVAQTLGRWGNFMNQEAHGGLVPGETLDQQRAFLGKFKIPDFIIDQMYLHGPDGWGYYHPTFLYESLWNFLGFILLLILRRTKILFVGDLGLIYLMWYSFGRFFIEGMRTDSLYLWNTNIRTAQLISVILFLTGAVVFILRHYKKWVPKYYYELLEEHGEVEINEE